MEIVIAKTAGFCFGVDRAVKTARDLLACGNSKVYSLGHIIHNQQVVDSLSEMGLNVIEDVSDADELSHVIIRAHGVTPEVYGSLKNRQIDFTDATCPYVKKIHDLVSRKYKEGYSIIIVGDKDHPEVIGVNGWSGNNAFVVNSEEDVVNLPAELEKVCVVSQTTILLEKWLKMCELLEERYKNIEKYDTICNATTARQTEAEEISGKVDMMLVVGSSGSSNTRKLYEICKKKCTSTFYIETSGDLPPVDIKKVKRLGITAGASTPEWIIKEVIEKMEDINRQENEVSFKEAFESSLVSLQTGEIVKGKIIGFNNAEVYVDMGFKSDGIIPIEEFSDDPDFNPEKSLKVGEELEVFVIRVNDGEGNVLLSKKKVDSIKGQGKIEDAYENKLPVKVKVIEVVNGGLVTSASGIRIFIPASQVGERYVKDLSSYLKQTINVRIIEYNKQKRKFVGSQRVLLGEERSKLEADFWNNTEAGKKYSGTVKSITDFGVFVDIGGVDGLVHISELSWGKVKHPSEFVKIGDKLDVTILDIDREKKKISLTAKKPEDNPWFKLDERLKAGDITKGKVVRLVPFGAFVELEAGIDGLVHISQISNVRLAKPSDVLDIGQMVDVKIIEVNLENKKISLSIKEVQPIDPAPAVKEEKGGDTVEDLPTEHKEDVNVTLGDMLEDSEKNDK